jgi:hypothetical protein
MWWQQRFKWLKVCCQVGHFVNSLEVGLCGWKFSIKFQNLESLNFENISINSNWNQVIEIGWEEMASI